MTLSEMIIDRACWYVWNPLSDSPKKQYGSPESARKEAERLAYEQPGQMFFVLAPVGMAYIEPKAGCYRELKPDDFIPF